MTSDVEARLVQLEAQMARRSMRERGLAVALAVTVAALIGGAASAPDEMTLKRLTLVDDTGTPRMIIGSHLPEPPILGRRARRGTDAHGILLIDRNGTERGSLVTLDDSDAAMLSLDNVGRMAVQLAALPYGGARLMLRDDAGSDIRVGAYAGGPFVHMERGDRQRTLTVEDGGADVR